MTDNFDQQQGVRTPRVMAEGLEACRLSSQERLSVAKGLLSVNNVDRMYVKDIVYCVAAMVPELNSEERFAFVKMIYDFLNAKLLDEGREAFRVFDGALGTCMSDTERREMVRYFREGLSPDQVLKSEASLWGMAYLGQHYDLIGKKEMIEDWMLFAEKTGLKDEVTEAINWLIYQSEPEFRGDLAIFIAENFKRGGSKFYRHFILRIVTRIFQALNESQRLLVADLVIPLVIDTDFLLAQLAMEFIAGHVEDLPADHRFSFALVIAGTLKDPALKSDAEAALEKMLAYLFDTEERQRIRSLLHPEDSVGEISESTSFDGGAVPAWQQVHFNRD